MIALKRSWMVALGLLGVLLLAGCGAAGAGVYGSGGGGAPPTSTVPAPSTAPAVKSATATVGGASASILTNAQGMTLYYFDSDSTTTSACTGSCTQLWPALISSSGAPAAPSGVNGNFSIINGGNGAQVAYNGHPLYTYSGDTAPGQTKGNGLFGKWHVATPSTAQNTNAGSNNPGYGNNGY